MTGVIGRLFSCVLINFYWPIFFGHLVCFFYGCRIFFFAVTYQQITGSYLICARTRIMSTLMVISLLPVFTHAKLGIFESDHLQVSCIHKLSTATHFIAHSQPCDVPHHTRHLQQMTLPFIDTISQHSHSLLLSDAMTTATSFHHQSHLDPWHWHHQPHWSPLIAASVRVREGVLMTAGSVFSHPFFFHHPCLCLPLSDAIMTPTSFRSTDCYYHQVQGSLFSW